MHSFKIAIILASVGYIISTGAFAQTAEYAPIGKHASSEAYEGANSEEVQALLPTPQKEGDVTYVSGGIGESERAALQNMAKNYNLNIELAERNGDYIGDSTLEIRNRKGESLLTMTPDGPLVFVQLPAGTYTVAVTYEGKTQNKKVSVGSSLKKLTYYW